MHHVVHTGDIFCAVIAISTGVYMIFVVVNLYDTIEKDIRRYRKTFIYTIQLLFTLYRCQISSMHMQIN